MKVCLRTAGLLALVALACPTEAGAQAWPSRPIEWIVPFAPGGSTDVLARLVADKLKDRLGQPIVIVNRGGANADIGYKAAAAAAPDGHTIVLTVPSLVTNPFQLKSAIEPSSSRARHLSGRRSLCSACLRKNSLRPTIQDAVARIRSKPKARELRHDRRNGLVGVPDAAVIAKSELLQVPYRGVEPATVADHGGRYRSGFQLWHHCDTADWNSGRVKALATHRIEAWVAAVPRSCRPSAKYCRTLRFSAGAAVSVPAATPAEIVARLNREMNAVLKMPEISARLKADGLAPVGGTSEEFCSAAEGCGGRCLGKCSRTPV